MPIRLQETASELQEGDKIISELTRNIDNSSKTYIEWKLSPERIDILKKTLKNSLPTKVLAAENVYQKMRSERGESILPQDYDDIRWFLKHQVLKELYDNANNELVLLWKEKDVIIEEESKKEWKFSEKLNKLKNELESAKVDHDNKIYNLQDNPEYNKLMGAHSEKSKNDGAITVLNQVLTKLNSEAPDADTENIKDRIYEEWEINNKVKAIINEMDETLYILDDMTAKKYIDKIDEIINTNWTSDYLKWYLTKYKDALNNFVITLDLEQSWLINIQEKFIDEKVWSILDDNIASQLWVLKEVEEIMKIFETNKAQKKTEIEKLLAAKKSLTNILDTNVTTAEAEFKKKVEEIKKLADDTQDKSREVWNAEGALDAHQTAKKEAEVLKKKIEADGKEINKTSEKVSESEKKLINSQKLRINAKDLIVREEPKKDSNRMREHNRSDLKELGKLQPGNMVTPVLDKDGNLITEKDGDRIYVKIIVPAEIQTAFPPYTNLEGWIALSDKIGGKYKQEYVDLVFEQDLKAKEYQLTTDGVRLRTGFNTNADIIDTLNTDKIQSITRIIRNEAWDSAPEGSGLKWYEVAVTYKDGSTKTGYIAEKYLKEKEEVIEWSSLDEATKAVDAI